MKIIFPLLFTLSTFISFAQDFESRIGDWKSHNSYANGLKVTEAGSRIYCQTLNGIFYYNMDDNSVNPLTKLDGITEMEISTMGYDQVNECLLLAYKSTNIDILKNNTIFTITDIYRKSIPGKKQINNLYFYDNKVYISCAFGIVVYDLLKREVRETYSEIGPAGKLLEIFSVTINNGFIYAATQDGVLKAASTGSNLQDFHSWSNIKTGRSTLITAFNNNIYSYINEKIFSYNGTSWSSYIDSLDSSVVNMKVCHNKLIICSKKGIYTVNNSGQIDINNEKSANDAILDNAGFLWYPVNLYGLIKYDPLKTYSFTPNGPWSNSPWQMTFYNKTLWTIQGATDDSWKPSFRRGSLSWYGYLYSNKNWFNKFGMIDPTYDQYNDFISLAVDPSNEHVFTGSFGKGLIEISDGVITNNYTKNNSSLKATVSGFDSNTVIVSGLVFDKNGSLWVCNRGALEPLSVRSSKGVWKSYSLGPGNNNLVGKIIVDDFNKKWILLQREYGILVFDETEPNNKYKRLSTGTGNGNLPVNIVYDIANDLDGKIWIGTDEGVAVFYDPSLVFTNYNFDAQKIWVDNGDNSGYLLGTEAVTAIAVDGANKKWLGTKRGVWYVSSDGSEIIYNFTTKNSPLPSDYIRDISIDPTTGEVYFATEKGIVSFRNTATEGGEKHENVYAYPNPVKPDYSGPIAIKGLIRDANVKITDITGNLVFETTAEGGQAIWEGKNFSGSPVKSGIYLVFSSNDDGTETIITKILIIR